MTSPNQPPEPVALRSLLLTVIAAGVLALLVSLALWPTLRMSGWNLVLAVAAAIPLFRFPYQVTRDEAVEVDELLLVVLLPLLPGPVIASVLAAGCLLSCTLRGHAPLKACFNAATKALAATAAVSAVHLLGFQSSPISTQVFLSVLAAALYLLVNTVLVSGVLSLLTSEPFPRRLRALLRGAAPFWAIATGYGVLVAIAAQVEPWALLLGAFVAAIAIGSSYHGIRDREESRRLANLYDAAYLLNEAGAKAEAEEILVRIAGNAFRTDVVRLQEQAPDEDVPNVPLPSQKAWLVLPHLSERFLPSEETRLLGVMGSVADGALRRLDLVRELEHQSMHDHLTGANNRRYFEGGVERLVAQGAPFSLALVDVDGFKAINDTHGHYVGDRVLVRLAREARSVFRESDQLCRLGGDEFALLLPGLSPMQAKARLQGLQERLKNTAEDEEGETTPGIAISVGVVAFPLQARDSDDLLVAADGALYEAKRAGRNRIVALCGV